MEDALAPNIPSYKFSELNRLNPCFNGRCTRTEDFFNDSIEVSEVLILVLMEDALARLQN